MEEKKEKKKEKAAHFCHQRRGAAKREGEFNLGRIVWRQQIAIGGHQKREKGPNKYQLCKSNLVVASSVLSSGKKARELRTSSTRRTTWRLFGVLLAFFGLFLASFGAFGTFATFATCHLPFEITIRRQPTLPNLKQFQFLKRRLVFPKLKHREALLSEASF